MDGRYIEKKRKKTNEKERYPPDAAKTATRAGGKPQLRSIFYFWSFLERERILCLLIHKLTKQLDQNNVLEML